MKRPLRRIPGPERAKTTAGRARHAMRVLVAAYDTRARSIPERLLDHDFESNDGDQVVAHGIRLMETGDPLGVALLDALRSCGEYGVSRRSGVTAWNEYADKHPAPLAPLGFDERSGLIVRADGTPASCDDIFDRILGAFDSGATPPPV